MNELICFVAIEFINDENVKGSVYWYECAFNDIKIGDTVAAPLGRHNRVQEGLVRKIKFADEPNAPFPVQYIKSITKIIRGETQCSK